MSKKEERKHALLSASSAHRWLICTPSARLEENFPDEGSEYAAEGSLAHAIAELKVRKYSTVMTNQKYGRDMKKLEADPLYQAEMQRHTDYYLDYIKGQAMQYSTIPHIAAETRLDLNGYVPEGFGTADCIIIGDNTLEVVDFKYGKGIPVSAENNPQMRLYALGALQRYAMLYPVATVRMTIIQPRIDNSNSSEMSVNDLLSWGESIKPIAAKAYNGVGEYIPGEHCRFCKAKATCRSRANTYTALQDFGGELPPSLSDEEVGHILRVAGNLKQWVSDVEEYALKTLVAGGEIPGWKIVEGRSNRVINDVDACFKRLIAGGIQEEMLYERKPITLTAIEKMVGKQYVNDNLSDFIEKPQGKPTLAVAEDSRPAMQLHQTAAEDFGTTTKI